MGAIERDTAALPGRKGGGLHVKSPGGISRPTVPAARPIVAVGNYRQADVVGFDCLAKTVRSQLQHYLAGTHLCSGASDPITLRRSNGDTYQRQSGWWASRDVFVLIEATRELRLLGDKRFAPAGEWVATVVVHPLSNVEEQTKRYIRRTTQGHADGAPADEQRFTADPIELLPDPVQKWIGDADWTQAWTHTSSRLKGARIDETVVAYRDDGTTVFALSAHRTATTEEGLPGADWRVTTIRGTLGAPQEASLSAPAHPTAALPRASHLLGMGTRAMTRRRHAGDD